MGGEGRGDFLLVEFLPFGGEQGDGPSHEGNGDVVSFFQGQPDLVTGARSSGAGGCDHVGVVRSNDALLGDGGQLEAALGEGFLDLGLVEGLAFLQEDKGPEAGGEDFGDSVLRLEGRTDPPFNASPTAFDKDGRNSNGVGSDFGLRSGSVLSRIHGRRQGQGAGDDHWYERGVFHDSEGIISQIGRCANREV